IKFINEGYQLAQIPEIRQTLAQLKAQIEVERARTYVEMDDETQFLSKLYAICEAIKTDVQVPQGYNELLYFVDGFESDSDKDDWLRDSILGIDIGSKSANMDPRIPGVIHIVIGFRDILAGEIDNGEKHWEIAGQQFQLTPFAINYLLQVYIEERDVDVARRDELVTTAIEMYPQSPHFYATRGRYFLDDENYKGAIEDLEFAAARIPKAKTIFENLIECYNAIEDPENAAKYQAKIDELIVQEAEDQLATGFSSATNL
ncbi:MAG: hypothetical protein AAGA30_01285, partial [Planctomycetota bacterium]